MTYPNTPGHAAGSATSQAAAETLYDREGLHFFVLSCLYMTPSGLIVDEVKLQLEHEKGRTFDRSTVAARFTELKAQEMIIETADTRTSNRGKAASVWKLTTKGRDYVLNA